MINTNSVDVVNVTNPCYSRGKSPKQGPVNVKGRLKEQLSFWHKINANQWVALIIRDGYALPFVELPPRKEMVNHKSAFDENEFVTQQIEELLLAGCVTEVSHSDVHVISPLGVVKNSVKKKLILDLRYVNNFLCVTKFKYEDICTARYIFSPGDWFLNLTTNQDTTMWTFSQPIRNSFVLVGLWQEKRSGLCSLSFPLA